MAVSWSWAFGQETAPTLRDDMGWQNYGSASYVAPSTTFTYSYAGSPTRYSIAIDDDYFGGYLTIPTAASVVTGWVAIPFHVDGAYSQNTNLLVIKGGASGRRVYVYMNNAGAETFNLYVDNTFKETFVMPANTWNYLALKYDMSTTTWSGQVFLNGAAITLAYTDGGATAETSSQTTLGGVASGVRNAYIGQVIVYDDLADAGETPLFVTRCAPSADDAGQTSAGWAPVGAASNFAASGTDPLDLAKYSLEATPVSGDAVVTSVDLSTALGITAGIVSACTGHTYSSGTAFQGQSHVGINGAAYSAGNIVSPVSTDQSYSYSTVTSALTGASLIDCKYEIV